MVVAPALLGVTATSFGIEYSVHECPRRHREYVEAIFPGVDLEGKFFHNKKTLCEDMLIIPTCQRSDVDLVHRGEQVENEKDRLLERFMEFAKHVCNTLEKSGFWADYIDPCSGLPMVHRDTGSVYGEVEALCTLLGYKTQNAGCCKIILHPKWGSSVYPASMFAKAPVEVVRSAMVTAEKELADALK